MNKIKVKQLISNEIKCFCNILKQEMENLEKKLEEVLALSLLDQNTLSSHTSNKNEFFVASKIENTSETLSTDCQNISRQKDALIATNQLTDYTEVIDLTEFFEDLDVPHGSVSKEDTPTSSSYESRNRISDSIGHYDSTKDCALIISSQTVDSNEDFKNSNLPKTFEFDDVPIINNADKTDSNFLENSPVKSRTPADDIDSEKNCVQLNIMKKISNDTNLPKQPSIAASGSNSGMKQISIPENRGKSEQNCDFTALNCTIGEFIDQESGLKKYVCPFCSRQSNSERVIRRHLPVHTGERRYFCVICDKGFKRAAHMRNHMVTHTGEKPYKCDICSKALSSHGSLINHKRNIHDISTFLPNSKRNAKSDKTSKRPYVCNVCERSFTQKSHRDLHMSSFHYGIKKFKCSICCVSFSRKEHLERHIRSHTGEKPYQCSYCMRCFVDQSSMLKHIRGVHNKAS